MTRLPSKRNSASTLCLNLTCKTCPKDSSLMALRKVKLAKPPLSHDPVPQSQMLCIHLYTYLFTYLCILPSICPPILIFNTYLQSTPLSIDSSIVPSILLSTQRSSLPSTSSLSFVFQDFTEDSVISSCLLQLQECQAQGGKGGIGGAGGLVNEKASNSLSLQNQGFLLAVVGPCGDWVPDANSPHPSHPRPPVTDPDSHCVEAKTQRLRGHRKHRLHSKNKEYKFTMCGERSKPRVNVYCWHSYNHVKGIETSDP